MKLLNVGITLLPRREWDVFTANHKHRANAKSEK